MARFILISLALFAWVATAAQQQDDYVANFWQVPYAAPALGEHFGSLAFTWDVKGPAWGVFQSVDTYNFWGDRYGFFAIRITVGTDHAGSLRAFVADIDGSGPAFLKSEGTWYPIAGDGGVLEENGQDEYVLHSGPPGFLDLPGGWQYVFAAVADGDLPAGALKRIVDASGRGYDFVYEGAALTVTGPSGNPIRFLWEGFIGPTQPVRVNVWNGTGFTEIGVVRASDHTQPVRAFAWGTDWEQNPEIAGDLTVNRGLQTTDAALIVPNYLARSYEYAHDPPPDTSDAAAQTGAFAPFGIRYEYFGSETPPRLGIEYARDASMTDVTHRVDYLDGGDDMSMVAESVGGRGFHGSTFTSHVEADLDSLVLPTRVLIERDGNRYTATVQRTPQGNAFRTTDFNGNDWYVTWSAFDGVERPILEEDPEGVRLYHGYGEEWFNWSGQGDPPVNPSRKRTSTSIDLAGGGQATWHYNYYADPQEPAYARLAEVWTPGATAPTRFEYYQSGLYTDWLGRVRDPIGRALDVLDYTLTGLPTHVAVYPGDDPATPEIEGQAVETSVQYNVLGQPLRVDRSDGTYALFEYEQGFLQSATDERGRQVLQSYNPPGTGLSGTTYKVSVPEYADWEGTYYPARDLITYLYDARGNLQAAYAGTGIGETFGYGWHDELTDIRFPTWDTGAGRLVHRQRSSCTTPMLRSANGTDPVGTPYS